jgi:hypothetical protein
MKSFFQPLRTTLPGTQRFVAPTATIISSGAVTGASTKRACIWLSTADAPFANNLTVRSISPS